MKDDVYLANRSSGGAQKVSLHAEGGYRYAITKEHFGELVAAGRAPLSRDFIVWERAEAPEQGAKQVLSLLFPISRLRRDPHKGKPNKPLVLFGAERPDNGAVEFGFFSSREPAETLTEKLHRVGAPIWRWNLSDGSSLSMVVRETDFDDSRLTPHQVRLALGNGDRLAQSESLTALFCDEPVDGCLHLTEVGGVRLRRT